MVRQHNGDAALRRRGDARHPSMPSSHHHVRPLFENNHARKCGDLTTAQGDQCVANNCPCVRMDVECDAYDICFNTTLVNDSCSGNDTLTTVSTSLSCAATLLSKAGRGCLVRSNKTGVGCDGTQIMECVERVFVTPTGTALPSRTSPTVRRRQTRCARNAPSGTDQRAMERGARHTPSGGSSTSSSCSAPSSSRHLSPLSSPPSTGR